MAAKSSPPEPLRKPNDHHAAWLLRSIWDRINRKNKHFMLCIVGEEGSGKSHTAIRIASECDPSFNSDRVMFEVGGLLRVLKDGDHEPGNFYVLDEAGVQLGRRTWQERSQVLANQALQLIRDHNLGLIFTLPRLGELDSQTQGRLQATFEIVDMVPGDHVTGKWKRMDPDRMDETGKIYKKYPKRVLGAGGQTLKIKRFRFRPPDPGLIEPYEDRKREFQEGFYEETLQALDGEKADAEADEAEKKGPKEIAEEILSNGGVEQYINEHNRNGMKYVDADLIELDYGCSARSAKKAKKAIEREVDF